MTHHPSPYFTHRLFAIPDTLEEATVGEPRKAVLGLQDTILVTGQTYSGREAVRYVRTRSAPPVLYLRDNFPFPAS